jgi:hypothetical protein
MIGHDLRASDVGSRLNAVNVESDVGELRTTTPEQLAKRWGNVPILVLHDSTVYRMR